ncbi:MAG: 50S ribosomal protein L18 [Acidobacteriota bacterium]|jgi:large subunit ribosomal protein L18
MPSHAHLDRKQRRQWRKIRIRKKISGTAEVPRVCVFRSSKYLYIQAVDDVAGRVIASATSLEPEVRKDLKTSGKHVDVAARLGEMISARLKEKGITRITFDRSGYLYHGRIKAIADGARKGGLQF